MGHCLKRNVGSASSMMLALTHRWTRQAITGKPPCGGHLVRTGFGAPCQRFGPLGLRLLLRVETGKAHCEQMFSALPLKADMTLRAPHVRFVSKPEKLNESKCFPLFTQ